MGELILVVSILAQAWATAQSVRLALRQQRAGWVFLALANALMLARRSVSIFALFSHHRPPDAVAEFIALLISLLMVAGLSLLLRWLPAKSGEDESPERVQDGALVRVRHQAFLLALLSLFGCAALSYFAYTSSREAVTNRLIKGNLDLASMIETAVRSAADQSAALTELEQLWRGARSQYGDNYLSVTGADGRLLLHTRRPEKVGTPAGGTERVPFGNGTGAIQALLEARGAWAGRNRDAEGEPQIAAYVYSTNLHAVIGVHLPARSVDGEIRSAALPWGAGIALIFLVVLPLSFGLLYHVGAASSKAAFQALNRQLESERRSIADRKQAEDALRESEERFRAIIESEPECVKLLSADGHLLEMNPAGLRMIEAESFAEVANQRVARLVVEEHRAAFNQLTREVFEGRSGSLEFLVVGLKGGRRWLESHATPLRDKQGSVTAMLSVTRDISERKQAEEALRESTERLRLAVEAAKVGLWDWDVRTDKVWFSREWKRQIGYEESEISERLEEWQSRVHPDDLERMLAATRAYLEEPLPNYVSEFRFRHKDGSYRWILAVASLISDGQGRPLRMLGSHLDITERKEAEERIRRLNRTYAVLSDIDKLIVRERAPEAILNGACGIAVEKGGFRLAWIGLVERPSARLQIKAHAGATPDTLAVLERVLGDPQLDCVFTAEAMETAGHSVCNDIERDPQAGPWREMVLPRGYRSMGAFSLSVAGRVAGTLNLYAAEAGFFDTEECRLLDELAADIGFALEGCEREAKRQQAQEELRSSEERFRQLAETISDVFWIADAAKSRIAYVSPAYEKIWGRSCQSLYGQPQSWLDAVHPEDRERVVRVRMNEQSGIYDEEYRILRPDGQVRWVRDRAFPVRNAAGEIERVVGVARDITETRRLEEQVRQSQKMEAIGQLAGGIAHDFNNILAAVLGNAELALADTGPDHPASESLREIRKATVRARSLVQQILAFSRQQAQERRVIALGPIVQEAVALLRATIPAGVELATLIEADAPPVLADTTAIHQILVNLCTNAWQAMEDRPGRIEVKLQSVTLDADAALRFSGLRPGRFARLTVSDTGKGMSSAILERIFEPFFTTKEPGKGTGLGLSVVHGIVQSLEGAVAVNSQPGQGTTFEVYLPAAMVAAKEAVEAGAVPLRGQGQHILYLDDEEPLVILAIRMLERLGYQVSGFTQVAEALQAFRENPSRFDLVITDLNMPGTSGLHAASEFLKVRPNVPVVLSSGHITEELKQRARRAGIREVLYKPNTVEELSDAIHRFATEGRQP